ncbi:MAG: hypothetical protein ACFFCS_03340 [Candidatus Hodarchaeota archaeon]
MATHRFRITGVPPGEDIRTVDASEPEESEPVDALLRRKLGFNNIIPFVLIYKGSVYETTMTLEEFATQVRDKGLTYSPGSDTVRIHTMVGNLLASDEEILAEDKARVAKELESRVSKPRHEVHPVARLALELVRVTSSGEKYLDDEGVATLSSEIQACIGTQGAKSAVIDLINVAGLLRDKDGVRAADAITRIISMVAGKLE